MLGDDEFGLTHTIGLSAGMTIQFLEADWQVPGVRGIAVSEEGFNVIEAALAPLRDEVMIDKFAVTALTREQTRLVAKVLGQAAQAASHSSPEARLLAGVSGYLATLTERGLGAHVCGI